MTRKFPHPHPRGAAGSKRSTITLALLAGLAAPASYAAVCGPGPHWVDSCASGTDVMPYTIATLYVDIDLDNAFDLTLTMTGPTSVWRGAPFDTPDPLDPGHVNRIDTEMVSMNLVGGGMTLVAGDGVGNGTADGPKFSPGTIQEMNNPNLADSFFDIFFELQTTPWGTLHNNQAAQVHAVIDRVPPAGGTVYDLVPGVGLYDSGNVLRARLVDGPAGAPSHHVIPEPASLALLGLGLGLLAWRRRH